MGHVDDRVRYLAATRATIDAKRRAKALARQTPRAGLGPAVSSRRMASDITQPRDRVHERRRAAALARHYRDQEGLPIAEISQRLGRAEATVTPYLYDPTGEKARAVKRRYQGGCRGCGAPTQPPNGKSRSVSALRAVPPGSGRAQADARAGSRGDARVAAALRQPAIVGRLVSHARAQARRRCT